MHNLNRTGTFNKLHHRSDSLYDGNNSIAADSMMMTGGPQSFKDLEKQMTTSSVFKALL